MRLKDERPAGLTGGTRSFSQDQLTWIAGQFTIGKIQKIERFRDRGNINLDTLEVISDQGTYLLQRINSDVFVYPRRVMQAMVAWTDAQREASRDRQPDYEAITLMPTHGGRAWLDLSDDSGLSVWRMMKRIGQAASVKSFADVEPGKRSDLARELGRGLAVSADLAQEVKPADLLPSLPGYRDTLGYWRQLEASRSGGDDALAPEETELRESTLACYRCHQSGLDDRLNAAAAELQIADEGKNFALALQRDLASGELPKTAIHGDTKIENFLFDTKTGRTKSLVDLDTIMAHHWLVDWGDMMRSLCNVAGEKEEDLSKISVDKSIYLNVADGFTSQMPMSEGERARMADAVPTIAYELGIRFLADYLRGDNYFQLADGDPKDLNLTRARVQLRLYQLLREAEGWTKPLFA